MNSKILSPAKLDRIRTAYPISTVTPGESSGSPILGLLVSTDRAQLARLMIEHRYEPGEILFKEGDIGEEMYIIRSGRVAVVKGDFDSPTVLGYRGPGEIIGEMALLEDRPRSASVVAIEDLQILCISRENFQQFLESNAAVGLGILGVLSSRLRAADEARRTGVEAEKQLTQQVSELETQKQALLELQRLRQDTSDLILHDLRNPLSLIAGAVNLLELTLPEDILRDNREVMDMVNGNVERLKRLVDSLLDVTKMESGELKLVRTELNLPLMLRDAVERTSPLLRSEDIIIQISIADELPPVLADKEKINRVLANLMDNAFKYTPRGGKVSLTAEERADCVLLSIANTGPAIPPQDRERIFERFTRASGGQAHARGFGLGLAFCRLAVEAHGGKIWVEAGAEGDGNRFVFCLPIASQPDVLATTV